MHKTPPELVFFAGAIYYRLLRRWAGSRVTQVLSPDCEEGNSYLQLIFLRSARGIPDSSIALELTLFCWKTTFFKDLLNWMCDLHWTQLRRSRIEWRYNTIPADIAVFIMCPNRKVAWWRFKAEWLGIMPAGQEESQWDPISLSQHPRNLSLPAP